MQGYADYLYYFPDLWSSHDLGELSTQLEPQDYLIPTSFNEGGPLVQSPVAEHSSTPPFADPAAGHLLYQVSHYRPFYTTAVGLRLENVKPSLWGMYNPSEGETRESRFSETSTPGLLHQASPYSSYETPAPIHETGPSDVALADLVPFNILSTLTGTDAAGPSGIAPFPDYVALAGPSKPRKESPDLIIQPAKRGCRVSQTKALENTEAQPNAMDEGCGFLDTTLSSEIQKGMRKLVDKIRLSEFFTKHAVEPNLGTDDANILIQGASPELWSGHEGEKKSIYSLFVKVDGNECKCLWCGDVQHGKLKRAIGHFRAKHLGHKPFACSMSHATEKVW